MTQQSVSAMQLVQTLFGPLEVAQENSTDCDVFDTSAFLFKEPDQEQLRLVDVVYGVEHIVEQYNLKKLLAYLDELSLFETHWGYEKANLSRQEWCVSVQKDLVPVLNSLLDLCTEILFPKAMYAYYPCAKKDQTLLIFDSLEKNTLKAQSVFFKDLNGNSPLDRIVDFDTGQKDFIAIVAVSLGKKISETTKLWRAEGREDDYFYLDGLAQEMLNAMTTYVADILEKQGTCIGKTFFLGTARQGEPKYQAQLIDLLKPEKIGISFSKGTLMTPDYSSLSLIFPR